MKKRTKFLLALLSVATMTAGIMGIAGCKKSGGSTPGTSAQDAYNQYVTYSQANGLPVLTYEQWLETITGDLFIKGEDGAPGAPGAPGTPGLPGKPGEPGATIDTIDISADGKYLVITYTDGRDPDRVKLPDAITHVHKYDDNELFVLIPQTDSAHDGLAYKVCKDKGCDHIELVVLKKSYDVNVTMNGKPIAGVPVVINGATAFSDENGVAQVTDFGELNDYIVSVGGNYSLVNSVRTGQTNKIDIQVAQKFATSGGNLKIDKAGYYSVSIPTGAAYYPGWPGDVERVAFSVSGSENEAKKFKLTITDMKAVVNNEKGDNILGFDGVAEIIVKAGETQLFEFTADDYALQDENFNFGDDYVYSVVVEELEAPAMGAVKETAITVSAGETITLPEGATGEIYYVWKNPESSDYMVNFTLNNVAAKFGAYTYANLSWSEREVEVGSEQIKLVEGSDTLNAIKPYYIKVSATGANASFSFSTNAVLGTKRNPQQVILGAENAFAGKIGISHWFKYTVPEGGGNYVIEPAYADNAAKCGSISYSFGTSSEFSAHFEGKTALALSAGDYYFNVNSNNDACAFILREYTDADAGISAAFAKQIVLENNRATETVSAASETTYYKLTASKAGTLRVTPSEGNKVYIGNSGFAVSKEVTEGEEIILRATNSSAGYTFDVAVLSDEELAVDHTFNVSCGGVAVENATVEVTVGQETLSASTDAQGVATLKFIPGSYALSVTKEGYFFDYTETANNNALTSEGKKNYNLNLRDDSTKFSFTLTAGGNVIAGAKIIFTTPQGAKVAEGVTDAQGKYSVNLFLLSSGDYYYSIELPAELNGYAFTSTQKSGFYIGKSTEQEIALSPEEKLTFTVTVKLPDGTAVEGVKAEIVICEYNWFDDAYQVKGNSTGSGVTDASGVTVIGSEKFVIMDGMQLAGVKLSNLPAGYKADLETFEANSNSITVTLESTGTVDPPVDPDPGPDDPKPPVDPTKYGASSANGAADAALELDTNDISNAAELGYYMFTATQAGVYTFTVEDSAKAGYIQFLSAGRGRVANFTTLIKDGKETDISYNLILGDVRGYDKTYSFTVTLPAGTSVVIGYQTGTGAAGKAKINVKVEESEEPEEPDTTVVELTVGNNVIDLSNGPVLVTFDYTDTDYSVIWSNQDVLVYIIEDGQPDTDYPFISGEENGFLISDIMGEPQTFTYLVTATSSTSVTLIVEEYDNGGRK